MKKLLVLGLLIFNAWSDLRKRQISLLISGIAGVGGIFLILVGSISAKEAAMGACVGAVLLLLSILTKDAIGFGDGLITVVTGCYLGGRDNLLLIVGGLFLAAIFGISILIIKKVDKKKEFPFVPFLLFAYIGMLVWKG